MFDILTYLCRPDGTRPRSSETRPPGPCSSPCAFCGPGTLLGSWSRLSASPGRSGRFLKKHKALETGR